jgi:ribose transport system ATP-binding protein
MTAALSVRGLTKSYGAVQALRGVDLEVSAGEVHALLGQNGCGKSTLVKSLTGIVTPDGGTARLFGGELSFPVSSAHAHGIAVIHQDLGLVEDMTVQENLGVTARYGARTLGIVRDRREAQVYRRIMDSIEFDVPLEAPVRSLSAAERAMLGVVRALRDLGEDVTGQLFVLDEPTAALGRTEAERVLALMRRVADRGAGVVFISHRLNEVAAVCDRLTVMRDGRTVFTGAVADSDRGEIVGHMLGRRLDDFFPHPPVTVGDEIRLSVRGLTGDVLDAVDLDARRGEIVGITGLDGMGQAELVRIIAGAQTAAAGSVRVDGEDVASGSPRTAIRAGIAYVPGNRLRDGGWVEASASENLTLPVLPTMRRRGVLDPKMERAHANRWLSDVGLHPLDPARPLRGFSGGNQQKVVFAKWLQTSPRVLLLEEPTQGVDAGAARELLARVTDAASEGQTVIVVSGDHEQLVEICHRVVVLHHGQVVADIPRAELSEQRLLIASSSPGSDTRTR